MNQRYHKNFRMYWPWLRSTGKTTYDNDCWDHLYIYMHQLGMVSVWVSKWKLKDGWANRTEFEMVHKGTSHCMTMETSALSQRQLMIYANKFLKTVLNNE